MRTDILIIGGGLAGAAAALEICAASQARVVLAERQGIGSSNPTPLTFADVIARFDLESCVRQSYQRFAVHSPLGGKCIHNFTDAPLVTFDYRQACRLLLKRAAEAGGLTLLPAAAIGLHRQGNGWAVALSTGETVYPSLVIDASGQACFSARVLGLGVPRLYSHVYGALFSGCSLEGEIGETCVLLGMSRRFGNGGGWFYPLAGGQVSFGYATVTASPHPPRADLADCFHRARREFFPYAEILTGGQWERNEVGSIPIIPLRRLVYDGLMIVGDAAGQATVWACMGTEPALINGQLCGQVAVQAYQRGDFHRSTLQLYEALWRAYWGRSYRQGILLAPAIWFVEEEIWDTEIRRWAYLTPQQMLDKLRYNAPFYSGLKLGLLVAYDRAGRLRRRLRDGLKGALGKKRLSL